MAKVKKRRKPVKGQDGWLENFLRFEIIVVLFSLIGLYYFLSFSPIRMPQEPIASPHARLALLPPSPVSVDPVITEREHSVAVVPVPVDQLAGSAAVVEVAPNSSPLTSSFPVSSAPFAEEQVTLERESFSKAADQGSALEETVKLETSKLEKSQLPELEGSVALAVSEKPNISLQPVAESVAALNPAASVATSAVVKYVLEVGSYVLSKELKGARSQIESLGLTVKSEVKKLPTPMYRVFLGPFQSRQETRKMMALVREMGDQPFTQKLKAGNIVVIASFYLKDSVVAWENMYHDAGLEPKVRLESLLIPHTQLLLDGPQVNDNPQEVLARVKAAGFSDARLRKISSTNAK